MSARSLQCMIAGGHYRTFSASAPRPTRARARPRPPPPALGACTPHYAQPMGRGHSQPYGDPLIRWASTVRARARVCHGGARTHSAQPHTRLVLTRATHRSTIPIVARNGDRASSQLKRRPMPRPYARTNPHIMALCKLTRAGHVSPSISTHACVPPTSGSCLCSP